MILSPRIAAALDGLDAAALPSDVTVEEGGHRLVLHLTAAGTVGLAFSALDFQTTARPEWTGDALKAWGDRIAARVNYLMEPLVVLEHDAEAGAVEIRSHAPTSRGDRRAYYEIRIGQAGALHLGRVSFDESTRRRSPVDCMMTREVLERLVDDLIACIP
jgi:hypothetical protein